MKKLLFIALFALLPAAAGAQVVGVKSNVLYLLTATPNLGFEVGVGPKMTINIAGGFNPVKLKSTLTSQPSIKHWSANAGARYWFCKRFEGLFVGAEAIVGDYVIESIPLIDHPKDHRLDGNGYAAGLVFGHQWAVGRRWGLEVSAGVGYAHMEYDKSRANGGAYEGKFKQDYFGPTKLNVSFIYFFH